MNKDEITKLLIDTVAKITEKKGKAVDPSVITRTLGWDEAKRYEIMKLFAVDKIIEIFKQIPEIDISYDDKNNPFVKLKDTAQIKTSSNKATQAFSNNTPQTSSNKAKNDLHDRIEKILNTLKSGLYEKDEAIRLSLLTALAGESIFLLGAPGAAKSMIARRITQAFKIENGNEEGLKYFEYLMNRYSAPEDLFGPYSIKALTGEKTPDNPEGKESHLRLTKGYLPEADIAFLDEIWKASPAIQNTLLTIINEKKFHNGNKVEEVPLKALFAASNELPEANKGLEALYDRFILRLIVDYIQDEDQFFEMVDQSSSSDFTIPEEVKNILITNEDLKNWKKEIDKVSISDKAKSVISSIRKELVRLNNEMSEEDKNNDEEFLVGDRRWKKIVHILKTSAYFNSRNEIDIMDCSLIEYCIWNSIKQQKKSREIVENALKENGVTCDSSIEDINESLKEFSDKVTEEWFDEITEAAKDKIVTVDGQKCYECTRDNTKETWYITVGGGKHGYSNYHDIYNSYKSYTNHDSFSKKGDHIVCGTCFTVNKIPGKKYNVPKTLPDITHKTKQDKFDNDNYKPIVNAIENEIKNLKTQKEKDEIHFKANLFANQKYNESIASKIDKAIQELEDAQVALDKERSRYYKKDLEPVLSVGDAILYDNRIVTQKEIKDLSDEDKNKIIGVICITSEEAKKTYALGINESNMVWTKMKDYSNNYGKNYPDNYVNNWVIPNEENLMLIWKNKHSINASLKLIPNAQQLTKQEYWSNSTNKNKVPIYIKQDGELDHQTEDHEFAVRVIRQFEL